MCTMPRSDLAWGGCAAIAAATAGRLPVPGPDPRWGRAQKWVQNTALGVKRRRVIVLNTTRTARWAHRSCVPYAGLCKTAYSVNSRRNVQDGGKMSVRRSEPQSRGNVTSTTLFVSLRVPVGLVCTSPSCQGRTSHMMGTSFSSCHRSARSGTPAHDARCLRTARPVNPTEYTRTHEDHALPLDVYSAGVSPG
jgi:hypothetical protein